MADFCYRCTEDIFGKEYIDKNDMKGLCKSHEMTMVLCEGCGPIWVNYLGKCLGSCEMYHIEEPVQ